MHADASFSSRYLAEVAEIATALPSDRIEAIAEGLAAVRARGGRLFILGVGGSAGNASHAVNDFRKICGIESYAPTDNVSELTARTNDEGWDTVFTAWLELSKLGPDDALLVFSVGGGSIEKGISVNLAQAVEMAVERGASVYGVVGRAEGTTAQRATAAVVVPAPAERLTPHAEAFQAVVWHLLVSHPALALKEGKWEAVTGS